MRQSVLPGFNFVPILGTSAEQFVLPGLEPGTDGQEGFLVESGTPLCEKGEPCSLGGCDMCNGARHRQAQDIHSYFLRQNGIPELQRPFEFMQQ